jgi:hypothetical protein
MKKYVLIMLTVTTMGLSQKKDFERVYVEAGVVQPLGVMSQKFEPSPAFGFWFRSRLIKKDYIDFGFSFFIPNRPSPLQFEYRDSVLNYKSKHFAINLGTRFVKVMPLSLKNERINLEWNSGFGLALNTYQAPAEIEFAEGEYSRELLTTFYLSQGIKINYDNVGLQCHYQWSPYGLFNDQIRDAYGSHSLMFGIVYRQ